MIKWDKLVTFNSWNGYLLRVYKKTFISWEKYFKNCNNTCSQLFMYLLDYKNEVNKNNVI